MILNAVTARHAEVSGRRWRFGTCEFDEFQRELRVGGEVVEIESKPLDVLFHLLQHQGAVVTREELLEAVWPGVRVVEGSLATAVSKLRRSLGPEEQSIVVTIPRLGYRLGVPVQCEDVKGPAAAPRFKPGQPVPGRDRWQFVRRLDLSGSGDVWLAEQPKTHETRVFKFAFDGGRLTALKREVTLSRLLRQSLGERPDFVRMLEWNFETAPFYVENEYCGLNLLEWAESQGGLSAVPFETRLRLFIGMASTVAAAHETGVLHSDLKPANILVGENGTATVADFGSGSIVEPSRLAALEITRAGFSQEDVSDAAALTGTVMYLAPEVLAGHVPTALADVYALGMILYQTIVGDFRKPLSPGWEADIADPLLREDVADAACGDPAKRLGSVSALVERLRTLEARRIQRSELDRARERAHVAELRLAKAMARRPWVIAAVAALTIGLSASLAMYGKANREIAAAAAMNRFLANDLLGRGNPFQSGKSNETLVEAVQQAAPRIDRQFRDSPEIAARLHQSIAQALDNRSDWDARAQYDRAAELFLRTQGTRSQDAIIVQLQRAAMEARSYEKGSLPLAREILARQEKILASVRQPRAELNVSLHSARGMIALIDNKAKSAAQEFGAAYQGAQSLPAFDENARLTLKQRLAFSYIRLGDGAKAEQLIRELIEAFTRSSGPDSPSVLRVRLNLAQAFMIQGKNREAVEETSRIYPAYLARLGPKHELTMQLLTTRAQCEGSLGLWDDAIRDDLAIYALAVEKQGPLSFFAVATLSDAALAQCRAGRYAEGEPNALKSYEAAAKAFGPRAGISGGAAYTLATCRIGLGKLQDASKLLQDIDANEVAQLAGMPEWSANVSLAQAEIAFREGDYAAAKRYVDSAAPVFLRADAEPFQKKTLQALSAAINGRTRDH